MRHTFELEIEVENSAFGSTFEEAGAELERLLNRLARQVGDNPERGSWMVRDSNGNLVGKAALSVYEDKDAR